MGAKVEFKRLEPLKAYYKIFGDISSIKQNEVFEFNGKDINIGDLVSNLRRASDKLTDNEIELLDMMGMKWDGNNNFEKIKEDIKLYYDTKGSLDDLTQYSVLKIGRGKDTKIIDVGNDLNYLRRKYKDGKLTTAQIIYMEMLGVEWAPKDAEVAYAAMLAYADEFGSLQGIKMNSVYEHNGETVNIGRQLNHLRTRYNKGLLDEDDIYLFTSLGIEWDGRKKKTDQSEMEQ